MRRHLRTAPIGLPEGRVEQGQVGRRPLLVAQIPGQIVQVAALGVGALQCSENARLQVFSGYIPGLQRPAPLHELPQVILHRAS